MEIRKGLVSKLRATIEVVGSENSMSSSHVTSFQLGTLPVVLRTTNPGASGDGNTTSNFFTGAIILAVGAVMVLAGLVGAVMSRDRESLSLSLFGLAFAGAGGWALRKYHRIRQASLLVIG